MLTIILLGYAAGMTVVYYPFYRGLLKDICSYGPPDLGDKASSGLVAFVMAMAWPLIIAAYACYLISKRIWRSVYEIKDREAV